MITTTKLITLNITYVGQTLYTILGLHYIHIGELHRGSGMCNYPKKYIDLLLKTSGFAQGVLCVI